MKEVFYDKYVSSGQAGHTDAVESESTYYDFLNKLFFSQKDRGIKILDIGCGSGGFLLYLKSKGFGNLYGVDVSREQVDLAKKRGDLNIQEGDLIGYTEQAEPAFFDVVIAKDIFEHLTLEELYRLGKALKRVLKAGGTIIGHVPNANGIFGMKIRYGDLTHVHAFNEKSLNQLFKALGFQAVSVIEDKPRSAGFIKNMVRRALWELLTFRYRLLHYIETGEKKIVLSSNISFLVS
ncbi:MAG: methyltransferase domain-containing protein [Bacteroidetes bacterium]|nr:methyltransferase domain-containing protein [Bacteroidota bacterium]